MPGRVAKRIEQRLNPKTMFEYNCPNCGNELEGGFGDNVTCDQCGKVWETEYELLNTESMSYSAWIVGEAEKE
jgi:transcription elongation factor Elf1